jgi:hypothetical protein
MKPNLFVAGILTMVAVFRFTAMPASAAEAYCAVTAISNRTGEVTTKETATGWGFTFAASAAVLKSLKEGQSIYANFTTR